MAKVVVLANQKSSPEKTAAAVNLAASLALLDKKVLLIDCDPMANATSGLGYGSDLEGIYACIAGDKDVRQVIIGCADIENLWLIPASIDLVGADRELTLRADAQSVTKRIVARVRDCFDYILIDCYPTLGITTTSLLAATDTVLIPVPCELLAFDGLLKLLSLVHKVRNGANTSLDIEGFLLTRCTCDRQDSQVGEELHWYFGPMVYDTVIRHVVPPDDLSSCGKPLMLDDAAADGAENYLTAAREFLERNRR